MVSLPWASRASGGTAACARRRHGRTVQSGCDGGTMSQPELAVTLNKRTSTPPAHPLRMSVSCHTFMNVVMCLV